MNSPVIAAGIDIANDGGRDTAGTALPSGMPDLGGPQRSAGPGRDEAAPAATTMFGNGRSTSPAALTDGSDYTSWAGPSTGVTCPGTITLTFPSRRAVSEVVLATHFGQGQGQGITKAGIQTWGGSTWGTRAADAQITWTGNTATVERESLRLPSAVATTGVRLVVEAANRTWGNLSVNEITTR
ncbi:hypothetical protein [Streptomyces sp. NPDC055105]|uniref:hypothetical protein n=1 Tax=Streptomyces sp. NPDC055105 TaxID=3365719 RepID=UPI0037D40D91